MPLTNRQAALAGEVKAAVERYRRSSLEAHRAYLDAGAALVEARDGAQRGEWGPFRQAAGVSERTAQNMMRLARAGAKPETVSAFGGVKGLLDWLAVGERIKRGAALWVELGGAWNLHLHPMTAWLWLSATEHHGGRADALKDCLAVRQAFGLALEADRWGLENDCWADVIPADSPVQECAGFILIELVLMFGQDAKREGADCWDRMLWWVEARGAELMEAAGDKGWRGHQGQGDRLATWADAALAERLKGPRYLNADQQALQIARWLAA